MQILVLHNDNQVSLINIPVNEITHVLCLQNKAMLLEFPLCCYAGAIGAITAMY